MNPTLDPEPFMRAARRRARRTFANRHDRDELIGDTVSVAWEMLQTAPPNATPQSIGWYATRRVQGRRQFSESERSITGPNPRRLDKPTRNELADVLVRSHDPAVIVQVRLDFAAWLEHLTDREQALLVAFLMGERTKALARQYGITQARVSQIRRELVEFWLAFTA